jgi:glucose-1-phosphate thymidylyltransferase
MKGIILAGGSGSRLYPITQAVSKQLLPVYDKPMIYYPISILMLTGIRDVLIITTPDSQFLFQNLLKDGMQWGMNFQYAVQKKPEGIAQAFLIAKDFLMNDSCALALGDNIFFGHGLTESLSRAAHQIKGGTVFGYWVRDPERYGVVEFGANDHVLSIEEKPKKPKSSYAVTGLYFYDNKVTKIAADLKPSQRGEMEITDVNNAYIKENKMKFDLVSGFWSDAGTFPSLFKATKFIQEKER